jgi:TolB-like protein/tetratricopeptide (TPR) repeat protein
MKKLLQELRRRRVFRLAALYIVGAWLVFQIADVFFPAWNVPDAALRYLLLAAILCFPVALVFGWFYDVTSDGIVRTPAADDETDVSVSLKRSDYLILLALLAVSVVVIASSIEQITDVTESDVVTASVDNRAPNSLAVLPFEIIGDDSEESYWSDGIAEEILQRLASTGELRVKARNSSFAFRDSDFSPEKISDLLSVRFLLTGTVAQQAGKLQISATLLDHAGFQIWSDTVDGTAEEAFDLQAKISRAVAEQVAGEIIESGGAAGSRTTRNADAYRSYLIGREYFFKRPPNWQEHALAAFEAAIELDPLYAPPYAGAAIALMVGLQPTPANVRAPVIERNLEVAFRLQPNLADAYAARGLYRMQYLDEFNLAEADLRRAIELDPSHGMAYNWLQFNLQQLGRHEEAREALMAGVAVDPLNPPLALNAIESRARELQDIGYAEREMRRLLEWPEPPNQAYYALGALLSRQGKLDEAVALAKESIRAHEFRNHHWGLYFPYMNLGMFDDAQYWIDMMLEQFPEDTDWHLFGISHKLSALIMEGRRDEARSLFEDLLIATDEFLNRSGPGEMIAIGRDAVVLGFFDKGIDFLRPVLMQDPLPTEEEPDHGDIQGYLYLHHALEQVGDPDGASAVARIIDTIREQRRGIDDEGLDVDGIVIKVELNIHAGDLPRARTLLARAVELGWRNYYEIRNDPLWSNALTDPGIMEVLDSVIADLAEQRARVEAANAEHDFKAEAEGKKWRLGSESNRRPRLCRPLHNHSAT